MATILLIDAESDFQEMVVKGGEKLNATVLIANSLAEGLAYSNQDIDIILLEKILPDGEGIAHIQHFSAWTHRPHVLLITHMGSKDIAERALRAGAWDFLCKPLQLHELVKTMQQALTHRKGRISSNPEPTIHRHRILGKSPALQEALQLLHEAGRSEANVLIYGETGVGKELFANALHENSMRSSHPFVTVDCASLTENLVESQLFGHAKGAFTGAEKARDGLILSAHTGTLFLDEVGELPLSMQKVFLRALELRRFRPVGMVDEVYSDFRLIGATNKDLSQLVKERLFRDDLLYRLKGITLRIPPLRERQQDIIILAEHAINNFCSLHFLPVKTLSSSCIEILLNYTWPGNVRELISCIERACIVAKEENELYPIHLPTDLRVATVRERVGEDSRSLKPIAEGALFLSTQDGMPTLKQWKKHTEHTYITKLLEQNKNDIRLCAEKAGVSRGHFYELIKKHNIS